MHILLAFLTLVLTIAQLSFCVPEIAEHNRGMTNRATENSTSQEKAGQKEKEKEESSLSRQYALTERVISQFYFITINTNNFQSVDVQTITAKTFTLNQRDLYLLYTNLRI